MSTKSWPADKVERRKTASLIPYARNARTHTAAQVAQIAASVREWGWTAPVLVSEDGTIIAGHGRVLAAQVLGLDEVPVMVAEGWTDVQRQAYTLADNKLALNAGWDSELLKFELVDLTGAGFDAGLIGFTPGELASELGLVGEEDAPSVLSSELQYRIIVECESEQHQSMTLQQLESEGLTCRLLIS